MKASTNEVQVKSARATRSKEPLTFNEACRLFTEWAELDSAERGVVLFGEPTPNYGLSVVVDSTWHLRNVNGPLARVRANGRVFRPQKEDY